MATDHEYLNLLYSEILQPTKDKLFEMLVNAENNMSTIRTNLSALSQPVIAKDDINLVNAQDIIDDARHNMGEIQHSAGKLHEFVYPDGNSVPEGMKFNDLEYRDATTTTKMMDGTYRHKQIGHDITSFTFPWIKLMITYAYADGIYCCICSDNTIRVIIPSVYGGNSAPTIYSYIVDEADVGYIALSPVVPRYGSEAGYPIFIIKASSTLNYMDFVAEVKVTIKKDVGVKKATFETYRASCDSAICIAVGYSNGILARSTDNGLTWTNISNNNPDGWNCICHNNGTWIVAGDTMRVIRSTDDGLTWTEISVGISYGMYISTVNCRNGVWIMSGDITGSVDSNVSILRSTDDGLTWQAITIYTAFSELRCIYPNDDNTWIAVNYDGIYRSTDDGYSWVSVPCGANTKLNGVFYANNTWIVVGYNVTYRSEYGDMWDMVLVSGDLLSVYCFNNTWIAVGYQGVIVRSIDNGLTWTNITSGVNKQLNGVIYSNGAWIVTGAGDTILRSIDDGLTWTKITSGINGVVNGGFTGIAQSNVPSPFLNLYEKGENIQWDTMYLKRSMTSTVWPYHLTLINKSRMTMHHVSQDMSQAVLDSDTIAHIVTDNYDYQGVYSNGSKIFACGYGIWDISDSKPICILESLNILYGISYSNNTWIAVGTSGTILRSIDNGLNWSKIKSGVNNTILEDIHYANNTWIIVGSGTILRSTDDGLTWTRITGSVITNILRSIYYSNNTWIIVGQSGTILRSTDDGLTWTKITGGVTTNLFGISYGNNAWIIVGTGTILRSTDNGLSWTKISVSGVTSNLRDIHYANNVWIVVGYNGTIIRSIDDGLTWTKITSGVTDTLQDIYYSNQTWITVGTSGAILRSTDNGLTWTRVSVSGVSSTLQGIYYANHTWIAVGNSGNIIRSTDNGLTWTRISSGVSSTLCSIYCSNNTWITVGNNGIILRSTDNGLTWTKITSGVTSDLQSIYYSNNVWIAVGYDTTILRSTDNGLTWTKIIPSGVTSTFYSIYYSNHTWIAVGYGTIIRSIDDGLTWTKISVSGVSSNLRDIYYANNVWITVGDSGIIIQISNDFHTWLFYRYRHKIDASVRGGLNTEDLQCLALFNINETRFSKIEYNDIPIHDTIETKNSFTSAVESLYSYGDSLKLADSNYTIIDKMINSVIHRYEESKNTVVVSNYDYLDGFDKVLGTYFNIGNVRETGAQPGVYEDDTSYGTMLKYSKIVVRSITVTDPSTKYTIRQYTPDDLPADKALAPRAVILEIRGENGVTGLFSTSRPLGDIWGYLSNYPERLYLALDYNNPDITIDTTFGTESEQSIPLIKGQYTFYLIY